MTIITGFKGKLVFFAAKTFKIKFQKKTAETYSSIELLIYPLAANQFNGTLKEMRKDFMFRNILCSILLASCFATNASQASRAVQYKPAHQVDYADLTQRFEKLPKDIQGLIGEFLAHREKKNNGTKDDFYRVSKELLPILLTHPCVQQIKTITKRTALNHRLIIASDAICNYANDNRLTIVGKISPRLARTDKDYCTDWHRRQLKTRILKTTGPIIKSKLDVMFNCAYNHCYNKKNPKAQKFVNKWENKFKQQLTQYQSNLPADEAFFCGYSDNSMVFNVLPIHKQTIDNLTFEQKQFLIDLYKAYETSNGLGHILLNASNIKILHSFPQELQTRILTNYPIQLLQAPRYHRQPIPQHEALRNQLIPQFAHRNSKKYMFFGVIAVAALSWIIWKKFHPARA